MRDHLILNFLNLKNELISPIKTSHKSLLGQARKLGKIIDLQYNIF